MSIRWWGTSCKQIKLVIVKTVKGATSGRELDENQKWKHKAKTSLVIYKKFLGQKNTFDQINNIGRGKRNTMLGQWFSH